MSTSVADVLAALVDEEINRSPAGPRRLAEAVETHKGGTRLLRVEDLAGLDRKALIARLPEPVAARAENRLLEGTLEGNMLRRYTAQLEEEGAPPYSEEDLAGMSFRRTQPAARRDPGEQVAVLALVGAGYDRVARPDRFEGLRRRRGVAPVVRDEEQGRGADRPERPLRFRLGIAEEQDGGAAVVDPQTDRAVVRVPVDARTRPLARDHGRELESRAVRGRGGRRAC